MTSRNKSIEAHNDLSEIVHIPLQSRLISPISWYDSETWRQRVLVWLQVFANYDSERRTTEHAPYHCAIPFLLHPALAPFASAGHSRAVDLAPDFVDDEYMRGTWHGRILTVSFVGLCMTSDRLTSSGALPAGDVIALGVDANWRANVGLDGPRDCRSDACLFARGRYSPPRNSQCLFHDQQPTRLRMVNRDDATNRLINDQTSRFCLVKPKDCWHKIIIIIIVIIIIIIIIMTTTMMTMKMIMSGMTTTDRKWKCL